MPGDGASIGEVYVDLLPRADDFWARVQGQLGPQADRVGRDIGKTIADRIAQGIRDGIGDGFKGSPGREPGRRTGEDFAGEFDRTVRTRIQAALKALPKAEIGASATEAEQKIRDLRASLEELSGKRIGVDISDTAAIAEVRRLQEELARLARETPSVRVSADATRASAELEAVRVQVERIARLNPNIHIETNAAAAATEVETVKAAADRSTGGMGALLFAGITLGPAIIPVAAAAAAAVAAIGVGALGAAGGIGVALLAVRGISDAVKAMGTAQEDAGKSGVQLAQRQTQIASAADSVRNAEASLANARANAAEATRRAAETEANAQLSLAQAEQTALRAEQDLARARESARRAMEDLATQVADGALAQRQAVIDLEKAEQNLAAVRANPAATRIQREEAQLAYDQAKQQIEDLGIRQQRLVTDNTAARKAGIDGSAQVVSAQNQVAQSQDAVRKAVQAVSDARIAEGNTARQNAFAIAQATQGVVSAQRSLQSATVSAGTAGSASMDKLRQSLAALTPEGQRFAVFLFSLGAYEKQLSQVAQAGFLPGAQQGLTALLPLMPQAITLVGDLSREVGRLSSEAGHAFGAPYWVQFFAFIDSQAVPALDTFGHVVGNTVLGVSALVRAFTPLGQEVGSGLLHFTQEFAAHALTVENTQGYRDFLAYVRTEGPQVVATIGELVRAVIHIAEAVAPLGGTTLTVIRLLAETINAIPTPVLTVLAGGIIAVTIATRAWSLAQGALGAITPAVTGAQLLFSQTMSGARAAMADALPTANNFAIGLAGVTGGAKGAASGVSGLASMIGPGGLLGIGLGAAVVGFGLAASAIAAQRQRVTDLSHAMLELHDALNQVGGANADTVRSVVNGNADFQRAIQLSGEYGLNSLDLVNALKGEKSAQDDVTAALDAKIKKDEEQFSSFSLSPEGLKQLNRERDLRDALKKTYDQIKLNADVNKILDGAQGGGAASTARLTNEQQLLGAALNKVADQSSSAADKADALKRAQDAIYGGVQAADQAAERYAATIDNLNTAVARNTGELGKNGTSLNIATAAGRANHDALVDLLKASNEEYYTNIRNGISVEEATRKHDAQTKSLQEQAHQLGLNSGDVQHLIDVYGHVPTDVKTQVTVSGVREALTQLENLEIAQLALKQGIPVDQAAKEWQAQHKTANQLAANPQGLAAGGGVFGPGGPTDDLIPARLSAGEHVWTAAEVNAAGGHGAVEQIRRIVLGGRSPQAPYPGDGSFGIAFAGGGAVTWPFPVTAAGTRIPSLAEVKSIAQFGPTFTGPVSGNVAGVQAWLHAQAGKPYGWDQAGPGSYDCSGIVSSVYNLLHGQGPYRHTFSTSDEGNYFTKPGFGVLTAGWTNPGERGPGGNSVGHTAGVLAGLPFESRGGAGVVVGAGVTPVTAFAHLGHFDSGGALPPGLTLAYNGTGRNEWVVTDSQISTLLGGRNKGSTGPDRSLVNIEQFHARDTDPHSVAAELDWILRTRGG